MFLSFFMKMYEVSLLFQPKCALELREGVSAIQDFF